VYAVFTSIAVGGTVKLNLMEFSDPIHRRKNGNPPFKASA